LHAPQLAFVAETELSNRLKLIVETLLLERTTGLLEGLGVCRMAWGKPGQSKRKKCAGAMASKNPKTLMTVYERVRRDATVGDGRVSRASTYSYDST
jgi:hypothetical protein